MKEWWLAFLLAAAGSLFAKVADFEGNPAIVLSNGRLEMTLLRSGATIATVALLDDPERFSPLWNAARAARLSGGPAAKVDSMMGHFLCLDGFGAPSDEEGKAGYPFHGEASGRRFEIIQSTKVGPVASLMMAAQLPLAQEFVVRTVRMVDGENVAGIDTEIDSLLAIDRPISWAEHATIGPPFLAPGQTAVDIPAARCRVRAGKPGPAPGRLEPLKDFDWPLAPLRGGGSVNLIEMSAEASYDLAGCQIDPARRLGYATAFRKDKRLLFGYVFRRADFPWLMSWMNYSGDARAARGIEFATQPFDVSRRETVEAHAMFGVPTYRWLPAKSKLRARFLLFYTRVPDDFAAVADVVLENGRLEIKNKTGHSVVLPTRLSL
ncbi:MAG: hypothetical protein QUT30_19610 [Acidobacteriota bacterium]|nr:hypothetical protein [Acidobacteriota bacterium]